MSAGPDDSTLLTARNLGAFLLVSVIWGGTWLVIKDQLGDVPAQWSITYRFVVACLGMFALAKLRGESLALAKGGQRWALLLGITQFTLNFTFVYNAEHFITSGLVAVMFALLVVPNALLGRLFLGQRITSAFVLGSGLAAIGVALLFTQEYRASPATLGEVLLGAGLTLGGILSASAAISRKRWRGRSASRSSRYSPGRCCGAWRSTRRWRSSRSARRASMRARPTLWASCISACWGR